MTDREQMNMNYFKCDYADERCVRGRKNGWCKRKGYYCNGNGFPKFNDVPKIIDKKDVCSTSSIFGNYCIAIDDELLESLKHGEVLGITGEEYNIFIWHNDMKQGESQ